MEVTNVMESSTTSKCSKIPIPVDNEQDLYLSIQPNVNNPKFLIKKYFTPIVLIFLENTSRSNDARSS